MRSNMLLIVELRLLLWSFGASRSAAHFFVSQDLKSVSFWFTRLTPLFLAAHPATGTIRRMLGAADAG
jgi:hypothetical protein